MAVRSGVRALLRNILGSMAVFVLFLGVLELGLRLVDVAKGRGFDWGERNLLLNQRPLVPFRTFGFDPYAETDAGRVISSRWQEHYPLEKPPGSFRIVAFGGSTTENRVEEMHYPLRLQQLLRERLGRDDIEVINVANQGYATPHALILLQLDVVHWDPDLVILSHNINDLTAAYFPGIRPDYSNKYSNEFFLSDHENRYTAPNVLFQNSQLYWFLVGRLSKLETDRRPDEPILRERYGMEPPGEARAIFEHNVRSFVRYAQSHGITVAIGSQPFTPGLPFFDIHWGFKPDSYKAAVRFPEHEELVAHHAAYNRSLERLADELVAVFIDNDAALGGREEYFTDSVHYTRAGIERLAENYADALLAAGIPPR